MLFESLLLDIVKLFPSQKLLREKNQMRELLSQKRRLLTKAQISEQSALIVDKIFSNVAVELSCTLWLSSFGPINKIFTTNLGKQEITSVYAKQQKAIKAELDGIMATYAEWEAMLSGDAQ
jgi:hypothetical protein